MNSSFLCSSLILDLITFVNHSLRLAILKMNFFTTFGQIGEHFNKSFNLNGQRSDSNITKYWWCEDIGVQAKKLNFFYFDIYYSLVFLLSKMGSYSTQLKSLLIFWAFTPPSLIVGGGSINEFSISLLWLQSIATPSICEDFEKTRPPWLLPPFHLTESRWHKKCSVLVVGF